jgi:DNA modification methylase
MTYYADDAVTLYHGDCIEVMRGMAEGSVDAIVTDPPYGLEFMGREWDSFRVDDPGTMRHRGTRAGDHGETDADRGAFGNIAYGGGKRATTNRCVSCGKRDQFRKEHACGPVAQWRKEIIDPHAAPPTSLAFQEWSRTWALEALRVLKPGGHLLAFGGTRTWHRLACAIEDAGFEIRDSIAWMYGSGFPKSLDVSKAIDKAAGATRGAQWCLHLNSMRLQRQRGEACPGHGDESSLSTR